MDQNAPPVSLRADLLACQALSELTDKEITGLFMGTIDRSGGSIVAVASHAFAESGLTCALILRESHAVLHTWRATGLVSIDIFSCSTSFQSLSAIEELGRSLGAAAVSVTEIARAGGHGPQSDPRR
jgi:S-adenosylmethionine/arginine decarboxylase-like enzyme